MLRFFGKKQKGNVRFTPSTEWLEERQLLTVSFQHMTLNASTSVAGKTGSTYHNVIDQPKNISPISIAQNGSASGTVSGKTVTTSYALAASATMPNSSSTSGTSSLSGSVTASSEPKNAAAYASITSTERYDITAATASVVTISYNLTATSSGVYTAGAGLSILYKNASGTVVTQSYTSGKGTITLTLTANAMSTMGVIISTSISDSVFPSTPQSTAITESSSCTVAWNIGPAPPPDIVMDMATTTDHSTVTATYDINSLPITQPLTFNIYRSASQNSYTAANLIGTDTLSASDTADLSIGHHQVALKLTSGTLLPDPAHEFVFVVANPAKTITEQSYSNDTAYFQVFVMGAISHGLMDPFDGPIGVIPAWEPAMATALTESPLVGGEGFNYVIQFDWTLRSFIPFPWLAISAGQSLASQVESYASMQESSHLGNVVDMDFIGHSRGSVVISQAIQDLMKQSPNLIKGSYISMNMIDPHPASNFTGDNYASASSGLAGSVALASLVATQAYYQDPPIVVPSVVSSARVFFQHSLVGYFPNNSIDDEHTLNLWGHGNDGTIINQSKTTIGFDDLTNVYYEGIGYIGHGEVPIFYLNNIIRLRHSG